MNSAEIFHWKEYESVLSLALEEAIFRFGYEYPDIQFYGMCIDCNPYSGEVQLHFNDENEQIKNYQFDKWNVSEWKYFDVLEELQREDDFFDEMWRETLQHIKKHMLPMHTRWEDGSAPTEDFLTMVSRVANNLKESKVISLLNKTNNFRIITAEHDDTLAQSLQRILNTGASITIKSTRTIVSSQ